MKGWITHTTFVRAWHMSDAYDTAVLEFKQRKMGKAAGYFVRLEK